MTSSLLQRSLTTADGKVIPMTLPDRFRHFRPNCELEKKITWINVIECYYDVTEPSHTDELTIACHYLLLVSLRTVRHRVKTKTRFGALPTALDLGWIKKKKNRVRKRVPPSPVVKRLPGQTFHVLEPPAAPTSAQLPFSTGSRQVYARTGITFCFRDSSVD